MKFYICGIPYLKRKNTSLKKSFLHMPLYDLQSYYAPKVITKPIELKSAFLFLLSVTQRATSNLNL